ncbi:MAG: leucine--tRNA ligase [Planctomycetota bacterium]|jgi:leucyl-tRNA synthetase|nr:leucine--tRNA ligase [Planctomycetota bacterium]
MAEEEYNFSLIEKKWQKRWERDGLFRTDRADRPKFYVLNMYPYPSGVLHMGHVLNYTLGDVMVRYKLLRGYNVLSPMGWDSFGLPAENAAIRTGIAPHEFTERNIERMRGQMRRAGWGYDWSREFATSHVDYYRWNQWFFLKFYERGMVVKKTAPVNWCESCQTVLANEQVVNGGECERCGSRVAQKDMNQWFYKLSDYAERLLAGHDRLRGNWPDAVLAMQEEWIGKSVGAEVTFTVSETGDALPVFTTRPDTLWGVTFMSIAPEHPLVRKLAAVSPDGAKLLDAAAAMRSMGTSAKELAEREKEGVCTGFHVVNPVNGAEVPLWIANFALITYGTGAVMSVPAHDQRDWEFAKKYGLPIVKVIEPADGSDVGDWDRAHVDAGAIVNSGPFTGKPDNFGAIPEIVDWLNAQGLGKKRVNYRLRDWLLSRQRYWGTPIPIIYCDRCGIVPVPEPDLPVILPADIDFTHGQGNPLLRSKSFVNVKCPTCGRPAKRETDTMDTFVDSSWYQIRFADPKNDAVCWDRRKVRQWLPVDQYIGGIEHATMHLIYSRFFMMALHDLGLVDFEEPFTRLFCQGMVCKVAFRCESCKWIAASQVKAVRIGGGELDEEEEALLFKRIENQSLDAGGLEKEGYALVCAGDGGPVHFEMTKISKSKLNIVDPDAMMDRFGADTVRLYMLSDSPPDRMRIWTEDGINGSWRTINRLWRLVMDSVEKVAPVGSALPSELDRINSGLRRKTHQCVKKVTDSIEGGYQFNTAIARCNELLNFLRTHRDAAHPAVLRETLEVIVKAISPIIPHFADECWSRLGYEESVFAGSWPEYDAEAAKEDELVIPVQVNGKVRARLYVSPDAGTSELERLAFADARIRELVAGKSVARVVVAPGRMVNIAVN